MSTKIKFERVIINDNEITVSSPSTSWFNEIFASKIDVDNLLKRHKDLIKLVKSKGTKVSLKYKTKQQIVDNAESYNTAFEIYSSSFLELKSLVEDKVKKGFFAPCSDDTELNDLYKKRNAITVMFHGGTPMSNIISLENSISNFEREYKNGDVWNKIYL